MPVTNASTQENSNISWRNLATIASLRLMVFRSGKFQNPEPAFWFHAGALRLSASTVWYHCTSLSSPRDESTLGCHFRYGSKHHRLSTFARRIQRRLEVNGPMSRISAPQPGSVGRLVGQLGAPATDEIPVRAIAHHCSTRERP